MADVRAGWDRDAARAFARARDAVHIAAQWPAKAARAFVPERHDDSHTALIWETRLKALMGAEIPTVHGRGRIGLSFDRVALVLEADKGWPIVIDLHGEAPDDVDTAFAAAIGEWGLDPDLLPKTMPYAKELPELDRFDITAADGFSAFAAMTALAYEALTLLRADSGGGPARFWPHHLDTASLIAIDGDGHGEGDRSVNVGVAPGLGPEAGPYFYVTPWPRPSADSLSPPPEPFVWRTEGFTAMTAPFGIFAAMDPKSVAERLGEATAVCRRLLGAE